MWNFTLEIPIEDFREDVIKLKCYDKDLVTDDFIGETIVTVAYLLGEGSAKKGKIEVPLFENGQKTAKILINAKLKE
jgi:Ca2+-dependent lipid-binding protein